MSSANSKSLGRSPRICAQAIHDLVAANPLSAYTRAGYAQELKAAGRNLFGPCPFHPDSDPSFCVTRSGHYAGRWKCFGCGLGGDLISFYERLHRVGFKDALRLLGDLFSIAEHPAKGLTPKPPQHVTHAQDVSDPEPEAIPAMVAAQCHRQLLARPKAVAWLTRQKGLPLSILESALVGYSESHWREPRLTIPILYLDGREGGFSDIRGYRPNPKRGQPKMLPWAAGRGGPTVYPWPWVSSADEVVWCEGEIDALNLIARGVPAITATCGVDGALGQGLTVPDLSGKTIYILGDHDPAGQRLSDKLPARLYRAGAVSVICLRWPDTFPDGNPLPTGYDVSDWCARGATAEDAWRLIHG